MSLRTGLHDGRSKAADAHSCTDFVLPQLRVSVIIAMASHRGESRGSHPCPANLSAGAHSGGARAGDRSGRSDAAIANVPGKSIRAVVVDYPPGGVSRSHRHPPSAFIVAYVLSGQIRSAVDGAPERVYSPGESWSERPGAHHVVSANASATEPARLLAIFVLDVTEDRLVFPDP